MSRVSVAFASVALLCAMSIAAPAWAEYSDADQTVLAADAGLQTIMAEEYRAIPREVLRDAFALLIYPERKELTVLASRSEECGVLLVRSPDGPWERPRFVRGSRKSMGLQVGYERSTTVVALMTRDRVDGLLEGKHTAVALSAQLGLGGLLEKVRLKPRNFGDAPLERRFTTGGTLGGGVFAATTISKLDEDAARFYYKGSEHLPESAVTLLNHLRDYESESPKQSEASPQSPVTAAGTAASELPASPLRQ